MLLGLQRKPNLACDAFRLHHKTKPGSTTNAIGIPKKTESCLGGVSVFFIGTKLGFEVFIAGVKRWVLRVLRGDTNGMHYFRTILQTACIYKKKC